MYPITHAFSTALATVKQHSFGFAGSGLSWLGVITANETSLDLYLKRGSLVFAIVASIVTIWGVLRKDRRESVAE